MLTCGANEAHNVGSVTALQMNAVTMYGRKSSTTAQSRKLPSNQ